VKLLATGRDADVFELSDDRVLRRYRNGRDATAEAAVMAHVHALGYPVPRVHAVDHADLVLDRLYGPTMLEALFNRTLDPADGGRQLADLHTRLHALPNQRLIHRDLHPANVVLTPTGPVVIDWANATDGPPALDVALTAVIMAQVAVGGIDDLDGGTAEAHAFLAAFLANATHAPRARLAEALATRHADRNLSAYEKSRLAEAGALVEALSTS